MYLRLFLGLGLAVGAYLLALHPQPHVPAFVRAQFAASSSQPLFVATTTPEASLDMYATTSAASGMQGYSNADLLAMAGNPYADGSVPLGDYKYVTDAPKQGYVFLCNAQKGNGGSQVNGPWIHGNTWNFKQKLSIASTIFWSTASFNYVAQGNARTFSGNGLPINHMTGSFPISSSDPAHKYDANPNSIKTQSLQLTLPANPTYSATPYCMGGEAGIMLTGVPLFNAFDAGLRDAPAHEIQDACDGHPQGSGEYHYHSLSACIANVGVATVIGYALDGFPITGPEVADGKYLTTKNLDECHGITSEVVIDGKAKMTYHYVMTQDFPYSVSCFRGKPASMFVIGGAGPQQTAPQGGQMPPPGPGMPPSMRPN